MRSNYLIIFSTKYKLLLLMFALIGVIFVMLSTSRYGAGLSPDSVVYIGTARNIIAGAGFLSYDGTPMVHFPPLYPALLALIGAILGKDPLLLTNIVNALIFGLIVYLSGVLISKHLSSSLPLAIVGTLMILFSTPLFLVSGWVWSEPLFIFFVLLSLIFAESYLSKNNTKSLVLLSSSVALSFITRYVGVTLIIWGVLVIAVFHHGTLKRRIAHLTIFTLISAIPMGIWVIRNYSVASTLFGFSAGSYFPLSQNITLFFFTLVRWYFPGIIADHRTTMIFVGTVIVIFAFANIVHSWQKLKINLRQISPTVLFSITTGLFVIIYAVFVVISATNTYVSVDSRMISPIYVPLTLLLLILAQAFMEPYREYLSKTILNSILFIGIAIWLVYPIRNNILIAQNLTQNGKGYSSKAWIENKTIQYIQHRRLASECTVYTNGPDAVSLLANFTVKWSPGRTMKNSSFKSSWPEESNACLVWFNDIERNYLSTPDELMLIANFKQVIQLDDGTIYFVSRK